MRRIAGPHALLALPRNRPVLERAILFEGQPGLPRIPNRPLFPFAHDVFVHECSRDFVYHWIRERVFPATQRVWIACDPGSVQVLRRFPRGCINLLEDYWPLGQHVGRMPSHVERMSRDDFYAVLRHMHLKGGGGSGAVAEVGIRMY